MRKLGKLTVCTLSVLAHPAIAQETTSEPVDETRGLEEVVVTAQKRAENAQDVPIAISALTASALEQRAIGSVTQIREGAARLIRAAKESGVATVLVAGWSGFAADSGVGVQTAMIMRTAPSASFANAASASASTGRLRTEAQLLRHHKRRRSTRPACRAATTGTISISSSRLRWCRRVSQ